MTPEERTALFERLVRKTDGEQVLSPETMAFYGKTDDEMDENDILNEIAEMNRFCRGLR